MTFCGFHPRDHRYFAFITKVPSPIVPWILPIRVKPAPHRHLHPAPWPPLPPAPLAVCPAIRLSRLHQQLLHQMCRRGLRVSCMSMWLIWSYGSELKEDAFWCILDILCAPTNPSWLCTCPQPRVPPVLQEVPGDNLPCGGHVPRVDSKDFLETIPFTSLIYWFLEAFEWKENISRTHRALYRCVSRTVKWSPKKTLKMQNEHLTYPEECYKWHLTYLRDNPTR